METGLIAANRLMRKATQSGKPLKSRRKKRVIEKAAIMSLYEELGSFNVCVALKITAWQNHTPLT